LSVVEYTSLELLQTLFSCEGTELELIITGEDTDSICTVCASK